MILTNQKKSLTLPLSYPAIQQNSYSWKFSNKSLISGASMFMLFSIIYFCSTSKVKNSVTKPPQFEKTFLEPSYTETQKEFHRRQPLDSIIGNPRLKVINCGGGSTGTNDITELLSTHGLVPSLHYRRVVIDKNLTSETIELSPKTQHILQYCAQNQKNEPKCLVRALLQRISKYVDFIASTYATVSDTPISWLCPEFLTRVPHLRVLLTVRDPQEWTRYRLRNNGHDVICKPKFWSHINVMHPFDLVGCLQLVSVYAPVSEALTVIAKVAGELGNQTVIQAYEQMNEVNRKMVRRSRAMEVSLFGFSRDSVEFQRVKWQILRFLNDSIS